MEMNIYCDESCHLLNDKQKSMVLGAVWCPKKTTADINESIAKLKKKHGLSKYFEIKWTKISQGKIDFYIDLMNYYFENDDIGFRAWVIPDKSILNHEKYTQTHDDWYYKMHFYLIRNLINMKNNYYIYLDVKDTRSRTKVKKLKEVLQNAHYDFSRAIIKNVQSLHSHDVGLMQLNDILIGAVSYTARGLESSGAKNTIVSLIKEKSRLSLKQATLPGEQKFNLYFWHDGDYHHD